MNELRKKLYLSAKKMGYQFISYVSSKTTNFAESIGENCFILEDNTLQPFTKIGNNVVLWSGNHIGHHSVIEDHVFFTSHIVLSGHCVVKQKSWIGVNSKIYCLMNITHNSQLWTFIPISIEYIIQLELKVKVHHCLLTYPKITP